MNAYQIDKYRFLYDPDNGDKLIRVTRDGVHHWSEGEDTPLYPFVHYMHHELVRFTSQRFTMDRRSAAMMNGLVRAGLVVDGIKFIRELYPNTGLMEAKNEFERLKAIEDNS